VNSELLLLLFKIIVQNSAYLACLSWLAWRSERRRGVDAFHLVIAYALGVWLVALFVDRLMLHPALAVLIAGITAFFVDSYWPNTSWKADDNMALVQVIVAASIALIAFDWATAHTPISLPVASNDTRNVFFICSVITWVLIFALKTRANIMLRLGTRNRWAMEYWGRPVPRNLVHITALAALCWLPVLAIPLTTTGLLSSTVLKDVAIAILIARVSGSRGPLIILALSFTLSTLRVGVAFALPNNVGPPMVEAMVFVSLLFWLRRRQSRTAWQEEYAR